MAWHKRHRPKSRRAGCLLCKPWKHQAEKHRDRTKNKRVAMKIEEKADA